MGYIPRKHGWPCLHPRTYRRGFIISFNSGGGVSADGALDGIPWFECSACRLLAFCPSLECANSSRDWSNHGGPRNATLCSESEFRMGPSCGKGPCDTRPLSRFCCCCGSISVNAKLASSSSSSCIESSTLGMGAHQHVPSVGGSILGLGIELPAQPAINFLLGPCQQETVSSACTHSQHRQGDTTCTLSSRAKLNLRSTCRRASWQCELTAV